MSSFGFRSCHRESNDNATNESNTHTRVPLSWRQPKEDNYSDWTVIVETDDDKQEYHVHKAILGVGPKKSMYFDKLFRLKHVKEVEQQTSKISLTLSDAKVFPIMLDYMYSKKDELDITTENATTLRYLADYFDVPDLFETTNKFIQDDVTLDNLSTYLEQATLHHDKPLVGGLFRQLAENGCDSQLLSVKVAEYLKSQDGKISDELFHSITSPKVMPTVSPENALFFAKQYESYPKDMTVRDKILSRCAKAFASSKQVTNYLAPNNVAQTELKKKAEYDTLSNETRIEFLEQGFYFQSEVKGKAEKIIDKMKETDVVISVSGAGVASVNGLYYKSGIEYEGRKVYTKEGVWQGKKSVFVIYKFGYWYLSFFPDISRRNQDIIQMTMPLNHQPKAGRCQEVEEAQCQH